MAKISWLEKLQTFIWSHIKFADLNPKKIKPKVSSAGKVAALHRKAAQDSLALSSDSRNKDTDTGRCTSTHIYRHTHPPGVSVTFSTVIGMKSTTYLGKGLCGLPWLLVLKQGRIPGKPQKCPGDFAHNLVLSSDLCGWPEPLPNQPQELAFTFLSLNVRPAGQLEMLSVFHEFKGELQRCPLHEFIMAAK